MERRGGVFHVERRGTTPLATQLRESLSAEGLVGGPIPRAECLPIGRRDRRGSDGGPRGGRRFGPRYRGRGGGRGGSSGGGGRRGVCAAPIHREGARLGRICLYRAQPLLKGRPTLLGELPVQSLRYRLTLWVGEARAEEGALTRPRPRLLLVGLRLRLQGGRLRDHRVEAGFERRRLHPRRVPRRR